MLTRKRLLQKRYRIRDRILKKNLKESIYRLYNETVKDTRKEQYPDNKESRIRNNIP